MADIYQILGQKQTSAFDQSGTRFVDVWEVTYKVTDGPGKGTVATVQVPEEDHNADYVDKAIRDKIQHVNAIASL